MANSPVIQTQYAGVRARGGLLLRDDRAVIDITGKDRAAWLHNLVTNTVKTLTPGEGNYAFAANIKGRCVFDAAILVLEDRIRLDIDRRWLDTACNHLNRYIIVEDVALAVRDDALRFAVIGPAANEFAARIGCGNFIPMAQWQHMPVSLKDADARIVRHDFVGQPTADVFVMGDRREEAMAVAQTFAAELNIATIEHATAHILRIEAGIPVSVEDIDEDVVPPETGRIEQGISYHKGCYLGQEVIERMRAHNILARRLIGLRIDGVQLPTHGDKLQKDGADVGRITSACWSESLGAPLTLGYIKAAHAALGTCVTVVSTGGTTAATIVSLPVAQK